MWFTTQELCHHLLKKIAFLPPKTVRYVGRTRQRLADRIKQHVTKRIRKKSSTARDQPPRMCKNISSKINCESAIGQHLIKNPECTKTYTDDNFRIIGQARSSFQLGVLASVYIKTQNSVFCRQKDFISSFKAFHLNHGEYVLIGHSWGQIVLTINYGHS